MILTQCPQTQGQQIDLAGDAMSSTVIGAATLAALATFPDAFEGGDEEAKITKPRIDLNPSGESDLVPKNGDLVRSWMQSALRLSV